MALNFSLLGDAEVKVQETADDAAASKMSAIQLGYYNDPFLPLFVRKAHRRSPLINRGYYARAMALEAIIRRFIAVTRRAGSGSQIVSLGAGMDTTFFRLWASDSAPTAYFEMDFPELTARKAAYIRRHEVLMKCVAGEKVTGDDLVAAAAAAPSASPRGGGAHHASSASAHAQPSGAHEHVTFHTNALGGGDVAGPAYRLMTADLRDIAAVQAALRGAGVDFSLPTLFLSECVLVYLEPEESCAVIAWAARAFPSSVFVTYEQVRPHDAFGQIMAQNLEARGYKLRGLHTFPDLEAQAQRYHHLGYASVTVADMNDMYYRLLPHEDVARIERLELFDEVEEWHLMSAHYCIAVAVNTPEAVAAAAAEAAAAHSGGSKTPPSGAAATSEGGDLARAAAATAASVVASVGVAAGSESARSHHSGHPSSPAMAARPRARSRSCTGGAAVVPSMGASPSGVTPSPSSSTAAVSAMELVTDAISSAIGTSVESVKIGSTTIACGPESASVTASPNPFPVTASSATSTASGLPSVGATSPDALALGASVEVVHTKAGDVVFGTAQVDFEAIAEAEAELSSARHTREAVGMDVLRAKGAKSGSRLPAAILASKAAINPAVTATYDVSSIESASEAPTLECVLFPWLV